MEKGRQAQKEGKMDQIEYETSEFRTVIFLESKAGSIRLLRFGFDVRLFSLICSDLHVPLSIQIIIANHK